MALYCRSYFRSFSTSKISIIYLIIFLRLSLPLLISNFLSLGICCCVFWVCLCTFAPPEVYLFVWWIFFLTSKMFIFYKEIKPHHLLVLVHSFFFLFSYLVHTFVCIWTNSLNQIRKSYEFDSVNLTQKQSMEIHFEFLFKQYKTKQNGVHCFM